MYKNFFGLNRNPFELSPDPSFICPSEKNSEALSLISYAVSQRKGFVVLTGEVGTGKTLMLRCLFESWRREGIAFANIVAPRLSVIDFLTYAASDLGIEAPEPTKGNLLRAFYAFLSAQSAKGLTTVLVIDEAHQAPTHVLEEIRMLTNVETDQEKLVQVLLVGQPELDDKLDLFELRQLKQRIAVRCQLEPLGEEETQQYIEQRLRIAGADPSVRKIFPAETIKHIFQYSRGIPRIVNSLCDQALIAACAQHVHVVPVEIVKEVASRFRLISPIPPTNMNRPSAMTVPSRPNQANAPDVFPKPQTLWTLRPAAVVPTLWQSWKWAALTKRSVLLSAAAVAAALVLSVGGAALFHRSPNALAYSTPRTPAALVAVPPKSATPPASISSKLSSSAIESGAQPVSAPRATQAGNETSRLATKPGEVTSLRTSSTGRAQTVSVPQIAQSAVQTSTLKSNSEEVTSRRTIPPSDLSKPIAQAGRASISSASAPILDAQENLSPRIDIRSLDSTLSNPPTPAGGQIKEPRLISSTPPIYPAWALNEGVRGIVVIDALIDSTGKVKDMKAISGPPSLIHAAMDALARWKYEAARLNGQPIEVHTTVQINFSLP